MTRLHTRREHEIERAPGRSLDDASCERSSESYGGETAKRGTEEVARLLVQMTAGLQQSRQHSGVIDDAALGYKLVRKVQQRKQSLRCRPTGCLAGASGRFLRALHHASTGLEPAKRTTLSGRPEVRGPFSLSDHDNQLMMESMGVPVSKKKK